MSMTDLFNYLLPYPTMFQSCDPKLPPFNYLPTKLIVTALFGWFKKVIPHYQTEGVSIQSHLQLDVCLDSHIYMVLQQLLFQLTWERRSKIWCQYISTGVERLKSIQRTASSWHQISKSSLLYICISTWIFQLMWKNVIASFIVQLEFLFKLCLSGGFRIACMGDFLLILLWS